MLLLVEVADSSLAYDREIKLPRYARAGIPGLYARVRVPLGRPFARDDSGTLYAGGDWRLGPRVEAAWTSGAAIARDILNSDGHNEADQVSPGQRPGNSDPQPV